VGMPLPQPPALTHLGLLLNALRHLPARCVVAHVHPLQTVNRGCRRGWGGVRLGMG